MVPGDPGPQGPGQVDRLSGATVTRLLGCTASIPRWSLGDGLLQPCLPVPWKDVCADRPQRGPGPRGDLRPTALSTAVKRAGEARAAAALSADHAPQAPKAHSAAMGLPPAPPRGACLCSRCKGRLHWGPKAWSSQGFLEGDPFLTGLQRTAFPGGANGSSLLHLAEPPAPH